VLEQIHLFVEVLDRYFGNVSASISLIYLLFFKLICKTFSFILQVCELDIIFNFHKAYYILDELFIGGQLQENSKAEVLRICASMDDMMDESKEEGSTPGRPGSDPRGGRR